MCKVVGVADKVLIVQSMVNKETFVVKVSLQTGARDTRSDFFYTYSRASKQT